MRPFRFAIQASGLPRGLDWTSFARRAEALGYHSLLMPGHAGLEIVANQKAEATSSERSSQSRRSGAGEMIE